MCKCVSLVWLRIPSVVRICHDITFTDIFFSNSNLPLSQWSLPLYETLFHLRRLNPGMQLGRPKTKSSALITERNKTIIRGTYILKIDLMWPIMKWVLIIAKILELREGIAHLNWTSNWTELSERIESNELNVLKSTVSDGTDRAHFTDWSAG